MASKTSAVADTEPVDVLFALHDKFDILDFAGPLQVLTTALHDASNTGMSFFLSYLVLFYELYQGHLLTHQLSTREQGL